MNAQPVPTSQAPRIVVLASGTGSILQALLDAHADPAYGARVVGVISDRSDAQALDRARTAGVPTAVVKLGDFPDRRTWDRAITEAARVFAPDVVVLAGFMKLLGSDFVRAFDSKILNTHPSLLPAFPGAHAVADALAHGAKVTGCTVHLVDEGLDTGPIVAQEAVAIPDGASVEEVHELIKQVERRLLTDVVRRVASGGLTVDGRICHLR